MMKWSERKAYFSAYGEWMQEKQKEGRFVYLFSLMFKQLPGRRKAQLEQMRQEATWMYGKLATRMVRKPNRHPEYLPEGFFAPDTKDDGHRPNDGMHLHGLLAASPFNRGVGLLDEYFQGNQHHFVNSKLERIDVEMVRSADIPKTSNYCFKSFEDGEFSPDDILILPDVKKARH